MFDFIIIGGGVIGTTIARALSRYETSFLLLEKENDLGNHQTLANSAIIHSGHDPKPNTLKAQLCVKGNQMYEVMSAELDLPLLLTGAFVVAKTDDEVIALKKMHARAMTNGVYKPELISAIDALKLEPNLAKDIQMVLSLPSTKVTFPWEVALANMENAILNGGAYRKNAKVTQITQSDDLFYVTINAQEVITSKAIINCAGAFSDQVASLIDHDFAYKITPRKGEYYVLDRRVKGFIERVIYPLPSVHGKGVLLVPQVHGNILVGPTSTFVDDPEDVTSSAAGLKQIEQDARYLCPNVPLEQNIRTFSGVRATSTYDDFYIKPAQHIAHFYHVAGIDSPGLTAAPAIALYVIDMIRKDITLTPKTDFNPIRIKKHLFHELSPELKQKHFKENPKYGHLVCKCEHITEAEIIDAIHHPMGHDTIKGLKKRIRAGSGLCQGGYCESTVLKIISRETKKPLTKINYFDLDTPILIQETKVKK